MTRFLMLAAFQILTILGLAGHQEYVRQTATTFRIPLRPVDPFDLVRGRYFILNPVDASVAADSAFLPRAEVDRFLAGTEGFYGRAEVGFCPAEQLFRVCALARRGEAPAVGPAAYWSAGDLQLTQTAEGFGLTVDLKLDRFFIPNQLQLPARETEMGWELELSHRPGQSPLPRRLFFRGTPIDF